MEHKDKRLKTSGYNHKVRQTELLIENFKKEASRLTKLHPEIKAQIEDTYQKMCIAAAPSSSSPDTIAQFQVSLNKLDNTIRWHQLKTPLYYIGLSLCFSLLLMGGLVLSLPGWYYTGATVMTTALLGALYLIYKAPQNTQGFRDNFFGKNNFFCKKLRNDFDSIYAKPVQDTMASSPSPSSSPSSPFSPTLQTEISPPSK